MRSITYAQAIREAITLEMRRDETVFLMGEDVGVYGGAFGVSAGLIEEFGPARIKDTPISEAVIAGAAAGAAMTGLRPIAEIMFSDFLTITMDQIVNQAAKVRYMLGGKLKVPMVVRAAAGSGTGAAAQHSQSPEAWFANVPGIKIVVPATPADAKGLLTAAIRDDNPVLFLEQKLLYKTCASVPEGEYIVPLGKAKICTEGDDATIITYGHMLDICIQAAKIASKTGINAEVIDLRTLIPLDRQTLINSAKKTGRVMIVHEACQTGGFNGEIAATICASDAFYSLKAPIMRCCGADVPMPFCQILEKAAVPEVDEIVQKINMLVSK